MFAHFVDNVVCKSYERTQIILLFISLKKVSTLSDRFTYWQSQRIAWKLIVESWSGSSTHWTLTETYC